MPYLYGLTYPYKLVHYLTEITQKGKDHIIAFAGSKLLELLSYKEVDLRWLTAATRYIAIIKPIRPIQPN